MSEVRRLCSSMCGSYKRKRRISHQFSITPCMMYLVVPRGLLISLPQLLSSTTSTLHECLQRKLLSRPKQAHPFRDLFMTFSLTQDSQTNAGTSYLNRTRSQRNHRAIHAKRRNRLSITTRKEKEGRLEKKERRKEKRYQG